VIVHALSALLIFIIAAIIVMLHHYHVHPELKGLGRFMQRKDWGKLESHEFWIRFLVTLSLGIGLGVILMMI